MMVAKPTGMRRLEVGNSVRWATPTRIGNIMTTIGVLLANALIDAAMISVASIASTQSANRLERAADFDTLGKHQ